MTYTISNVGYEPIHDRDGVLIKITASVRNNQTLHSKIVTIHMELKAVTNEFVVRQKLVKEYESDPRIRLEQVMARVDGGYSDTHE